MGLLLPEGKMLKHLKEKPHHKIPYHHLSFLWRRTPQQTLRTHDNLKASCENLGCRVTIIIIIIIVIIIIIIIPFLVVEHRWNEIGQRKTEILEENLPQCQFVQHKPHVY
jgi:hypothetical protein